MHHAHGVFCKTRATSVIENDVLDNLSTEDSGGIQ